MGNEIRPCTQEGTMLINNIEVPDDIEVLAIPVTGEYNGMMTYWNFKRGQAWTGFDFYEDLTREDIINDLQWDPGPEYPEEGYDWDQLTYGEESDFDYEWRD